MRQQKRASPATIFLGVAFLAAVLGMAVMLVWALLDGGVKMSSPVGVGKAP